MAILGCHRRVQRNEVSFAKCFLERARKLDSSDRRLRHVGVVRHDAQAERERALRRLRSDSPDSDERQLAATQAVNPLLRYRPAALAQCGGRSHDTTRSRQQQRERMVGHFVEAIVGHIRDEDARRRRGIDVDVVVADAVARDDADPAFRSGVHHGARHLRVADEQRISAAREVSQCAFVCGRRNDHLGAQRSQDGALDLNSVEDVVRDDHAPRHQANASSSNGYLVKMIGPSLVTSRFSSRRTVCSRPG